MTLLFRENHNNNKRTHHRLSEWISYLYIQPANLLDVDINPIPCSEFSIPFHLQI